MPRLPFVESTQTKILARHSNSSLLSRKSVEGSGISQVFLLFVLIPFPFLLSTQPRQKFARVPILQQPVRERPISARNPFDSQCLAYFFLFFSSSSCGVIMRKRKIKRGRCRATESRGTTGPSPPPPSLPANNRIGSNTGERPAECSAVPFVRLKNSPGIMANSVV